MDADWSVEIGEGLSWIDVPWEGWVDLREQATTNEKVRTLTEVAAYPELADVLLEINSKHTSALTSKCDVFPIDIDNELPAMLDREELDQEEDVRCGLGSYIDMAFTIEEGVSNFAWCESLVRRIATELLAPIPMPRASVEIVIRRASFYTAPGYGLTIYAMGFGADLASARITWAKVMRFSAYITMLEVTNRVAAKQKLDQRD